MAGKLLADAGSTKTRWTFQDEESGTLVRLSCQGINPLHESTDKIEVKIREIKESLGQQDVSEIHFFGAGCAYPEVIGSVCNLLKNIFSCELVNVASDMLGAAIALFGKGEGIAGILGTGSNTCQYSDGQIIAQIPSLGFILGDEGGGVALGKALLNAIFKRQLSSSIIEKFRCRYDLSLEELIKRVYVSPSPAPFIASFAPFLLENKDSEEIAAILMAQFDAFFTKNIIPYHSEIRKVGLVGSVAFEFEEFLKKSAEKYGFEIASILKDPLPALEIYYGKP